MEARRSGTESRPYKDGVNPVGAALCLGPRQAGVSEQLYGRCGGLVILPQTDFPGNADQRGSEGAVGAGLQPALPTIPGPRPSAFVRVLREENPKTELRAVKLSSL